jgi:cysteinyl-tRNA synthetase
MSKRYLGETIDLHAGGQDLIFPHHENEIAQSEAASGKPFANYWMHNGYITIDKEKMSKSQGNFFTVRDILSKYDGEVVRLFLLSGHYRSPINYSDDLLEASKSGLERIYNARDSLAHLIQKSDVAPSSGENEKLQSLLVFKDKFIAAMDDDLNTADAIAAIFEMTSEINLRIAEGVSREYASGALALLCELAHVLGLLEKEEPGNQGAEDPEVLALIEDREDARRRKDWGRADEIRDILQGRGITLKDTPQGVQIIRGKI